MIIRVRPRLIIGSDRDYRNPPRWTAFAAKAAPGYAEQGYGSNSGLSQAPKLFKASPQVPKLFKACPQVPCIDTVIADGPIPHGLNVSGYNHFLGDCGVSFLAVPKLARKLRKNFPQSLNESPKLLPSEINVVQSRLLKWLDGLHIHPRIIGEFDDSALMKVLGQAGAGIFVAPSAIADEVARHYGEQIIEQTEAVNEEFCAISFERRLSHPAVVAITEAARAWLK